MKYTSICITNRFSFYLMPIAGITLIIFYIYGVNFYVNLKMQSLF